jgi:hypothetical protein
LVLLAVMSAGALIGRCLIESASIYVSSEQSLVFKQV